MSNPDRRECPLVLPRPGGWTERGTTTHLDEDGGNISAAEDEKARRGIIIVMCPEINNRMQATAWTGWFGGGYDDGESVAYVKINVVHTDETEKIALARGLSPMPMLRRPGSSGAVKRESHVNDYVRYAICTVAGSVLGLAIFVSARRSKADVRRFVGMSLGGASAGTFAGMAMASLPDFADMPFSDWWMPVAFATLLAVLLPKALTDVLKMADKRKE